MRGLSASLPETGGAQWPTVRTSTVSNRTAQDSSTRRVGDGGQASPGLATAGARDVQVQAQLLELAADAILVRDVGTGRIRYWNRGAEQLYGWSREEALGQVAGRLLQTRFPGPVEEIEAELVRTGRWEGELVHTRRDGRQLIVASRWAVRTEEAGAPVAHLEANTDLTTRKRAELDQGRLLRQAIAAEAQFRALLESAPDAMVIADASGRIELVNRETEVLFGYAREELLGHDIDVLMPGGFRAAHHRLTVQASPRTRPVRAGIELYACRKDGSEFPTEISLSPVEAEGRRLVMAAIRDISARQQARYQAALAEFSQWALRGGDTGPLLEAVVGLVARALGVEHAAILEFEPSNSALSRRASVGWADDAECHRGDAQAVYTLETSSPVFTSDLRSETRFGGTARLLELGITGGLSAVIPGQEQPFGILGVHARGWRRFSEQDVEFFHAVAHVLATAIERRRAEMALQRREQEVRAVVDNAPDIIARFDRSHRLLYVNRAGERATGMAAQEFMGRNAREVGLPEPQATIWKVALEQAFQTGREQTIEFATPTPLGERSYQARIVPETGPDSSVASVLAISRDVTEQCRAEEERAVLYREVLEREQIG